MRGIDYLVLIYLYLIDEKAIELLCLSNDF